MTAALRVLGVGAACFLIAILGVSAAPGSPDSAPSNLSVSASPTGLPTSPKAAPASTDPDSGPVSWAAPADIVPQCDAEDGLFPGSLFDQEQLRHGAVVLYFAVAFYGFCVIALVCENYFLPTVEIICDEMGLSPDIAAATFMSLASSAPELFVNVVTTFLTRSTMGVGTTVGSATFNVLGLSSFIGLAARSPISIRAGPVVRDSLLYVCAITITTCVVWDGRVEWWEALAMVLCSLAYLTFMFTHTRLALWVRALMVRSGSTIMLTQATRNADDESSSVASSVITTVSASVASCEDVVFEASNPPAARAVSWDSNISDQPNAARSDKAVVKRWRRVATRVWQFLSSPVSFALALTIVDCKKPKLRRFYLLTFLLCVVWIALAAYIVSWMLAVIGNTLQISDAVMGITLLAAGGSTPEAISAIIMARKGVGSVGIANGLGANTLNMLMNLGMPWLVRSLIFPDLPWTVLSEGLPFDLGSLLSAVLVLNIVLAVSRYRLCRTQGICSFAVYIFFIVLLVLIELNVFGLYKSSECSSS